MTIASGAAISQCLLAKGLPTEGESGEGKVTPLELFADGILDRDPEIQELIRAAAQRSWPQPPNAPL